MDFHALLYKCISPMVLLFLVLGYPILLLDLMLLFYVTNSIKFNFAFYDPLLDKKKKYVEKENVFIV